MVFWCCHRGLFTSNIYIYIYVATSLPSLSALAVWAGPVFVFVCSWGGFRVMGVCFFSFLHPFIFCMRGRFIVFRAPIK
ncbi:hypothetical protein TRSC58_07358 [Trypanosoma rangeli SC58]|uniref:Uncharacterized protein n=1 Tax=Trypanosoma rangeli SC58 TaxID=429131 RepID=A0A061IVJ1_TRYRA|nr:hypothetical protein TRSC58_07358 [Trypanosoma rangeli SC58]